MSIHADLVAFILNEVQSRRPPLSVDEAFEMLNPTSIGLQLHIPALTQGARLFRVRRMPDKPETIGEVGAPPPGVASIGRLNSHKETVLYVADSPDTAFAEARATTGTYCLSEWRTRPPAIALANGGFDRQMLSAFFPNDGASPPPLLDGTEDEVVANLFATLFTVSAEDEPRMYWWSIACGLANGFSHQCERTESSSIDGNTHWRGRFPLAGIAYPSIRKDRQAVNFAFNDLGQAHLQLDHVQWVERNDEGSFTGIDIATSWNSDGKLQWSARRPHFILEPGQSARVTKTGENTWSYENLDGSLPTFC